MTTCKDLIPAPQKANEDGEGEVNRVRNERYLYYCLFCCKERRKDSWDLYFPSAKKKKAKNQRFIFFWSRDGMLSNIRNSFHCTRLFPKYPRKGPVVYVWRGYTEPEECLDGGSRHHASQTINIIVLFKRCHTPA